MADTSIDVDPGTGADKKGVDFRTEATNGNYRQVIVIGDPSTNAGVAPVDATNGLAVDVKQSALPSGAATGAKQDTGNTSLSSIDGKITAVDTGAVVVSSSALPTGAATSAKQDTIIGHVDGIEGLLTTIDADTGTIANAVGSLPADGGVSGINGFVGTYGFNLLTDGSTDYRRPRYAVDGMNSVGTGIPAQAGMAQFDDSAPTAITENRFGFVRMSQNRNQYAQIRDAAGNERGVNVNAQNQLEVATSASSTGGESNYSALSTAAVLAAEIKNSAGTVYDVQCFNNGANEVFVRIYNQTGSPGTGDAANIIWRGMIPGNAAGAGFAVQFPKGRACATGIGIRVTGAVADNDNTALSANEVMINVGYK